MWNHLLHFYKDQRLLVEGPLSNLTEYVLSFPKPKVPYSYKPGTHGFNQLTATVQSALESRARLTAQQNAMAHAQAVAAAAVAYNQSTAVGAAAAAAGGANSNTVSFMQAMAAAAASYFGTGGGAGGAVNGTPAAHNQPPANPAATAYAVAAAAAAHQGVAFSRPDQQHQQQERSTSFLYDPVGYIGTNQQFGSSNSSKLRCLTVELPPVQVCGELSSSRLFFSTRLVGATGHDLW